MSWHHPDCEGECIACLIEREVKKAYGNQGLAYLQKHVQRKPLTDEEIYKVFPAIAGYTEANKTLYRSIARAIEAAHGIKE